MYLTADELAHAAALPLVEALPSLAAGAAVVIVSRRPEALVGDIRTAFRFVNCPDRAVQIKALREFADILEGKVGGLEVPT